MSRYAYTYTSYNETRKPHVYHFTMDCRSGLAGDKCQKGQTIAIPSSELFQFNQDVAPIQRTLKSLTAAEREWFGMTGFCPACFDYLFAEDES